jgi:hypothetical protein
MNNILVFWGIGLLAILVVENIVTWMNAYVFIDSGSKAWILSVVSAVIWAAIWFWVKGLLSDTVPEDNDYDF